MIKWLKKKLKKRKCYDNCGQCVFLGSVWNGMEFKGLYCKKGFW